MKNLVLVVVVVVAILLSVPATPVALAEGVPNGPLYQLEELGGGFLGVYYYGGDGGAPEPEATLGTVSPEFPSMVVDVEVSPEWAPAFCGAQVCFLWRLPSNAVRVRIPGSDPLESISVGWKAEQRWFYREGYRPNIVWRIYLPVAGGW